MYQTAEPGATAWRDHTSWLFATPDPRGWTWLAWVLVVEFEDDFVLAFQVVGRLPSRCMVSPFDEVVQACFVMTV